MSFNSDVDPKLGKVFKLKHNGGAFYKADRIATYFVKWLGKSTSGLSYGLAPSEALIAPAMPSTTTRAAGLGSYLIQSQFQEYITYMGYGMMSAI
ncbi:hypothetical protein KY290_012517 [Solanum tuberosum]|uniref:Uncharacterized protein n=1 Tax=Solanum tuberosum TaxID=4113 RepID=A0ABQ7W5S5_SOLTU|nr:hypothetical protein KY284_011198 [Solanum tuberosum]KAH0775380.1 hypothetical protein KY290_012517 [Solanum tuberosum]